MRLSFWLNCLIFLFLFTFSYQNIWAEPGSIKWEFKNSDGGEYQSPTIGPDGTIYFGSGTGAYLYVINADGTLKWRFEADLEGTSTPAIGGDGTIYFGSRDNNLYALNDDGSLKWKVETGGHINSSPSIGSDGTIYVGSCDYKLYAINPDGSIKWTYATDFWITASPAIGPSGTIYIGSCDKKFYAINPDGTKKWEFETNDMISSSAAIATDGTIYIGSDNLLYAFYSNGSVKWIFETDGIGITSPAIDYNGIVYIGSSYEGHLFSIYPDGSLRWSFATGHDMVSPPCIGSDGTIYFGTFGHVSSQYDHFYALKFDGTLLWSCLTEGIQSTPAIGEDGTIYVGDYYHSTLYAINGHRGPGEELNPPWTMFNKNIENTAFQDIFYPDPLNSIFVYSPLRRPAPATIRFRDQSTGDILSWLWDFGDGTYSSERHPSHTYKTPGSYTVVLTINDSKNSISSSSIIDIDPEGIIRVPLHYPTIQEAIDASINGDIVLVADGIYKGEGNKNINFNGKKITVQSESGPEKTIIDCEGDGRGFDFHSGEDNNSILSGLSIINGSVNSSKYGFQGGGIIIRDSSPIIVNCIIMNNGGAAYGGGIFCGVNCNAKIIDCIISGNIGVINGDGGGIAFVADSMYVEKPYMENCIISGNHALNNGGGIYIQDSNPSIKNCTISGNETIDWDGGGIYVRDSSASITQCVINQNFGRYGGGIFIDGGEPLISDSIISSNVALSGGGIHLTSGIITRCNISNNKTIKGNESYESTAGFGGGIYGITNYWAFFSQSSISNCIISGNTSEKQGGGIFYENFTPAEVNVPINNCLIYNNTSNQGGGIYCKCDSTLECKQFYIITNCTITQNTASEGAALYALPSAQIKNSILWGNNGEEINGNLNITYSNIQGGYLGEGNIDSDPHFVSPGLADFHLLETSPCINAGTSEGAPDIDIEGNPRSSYGIIAIGSYEVPVQDSDQDKLSDAIENVGCTDPNDADTDDDGITDGMEDSNHNSIVDSGETNPCDADTDDDNMPDGWEIDNYLDPLVNDAYVDNDGDRFNNLIEFISGTNPNDYNEYPPGDFDDNGTIDLKDAILAIQICINDTTKLINFNRGDISGDGKTGIAEVIYLLKIVSRVGT